MKNHINRFILKILEWFDFFYGGGGGGYGNF
jgi:hypothetical protein